MISVTLITHNNDSSVGEVLEALHWCEDVVVIDRNSTDSTVEIAKTFANVRIGGEPKHDWVLSLHGAEIVSPELAEELKELEPNIERVYLVPVHTFVYGKQIRHGGWHRRGEPRLVHRTHSDAKGRTKLRSPINRYPFSSTSHMIDRISTTISRFSKNGKSPSWWKLIFAPLFVFVKVYVFQLGFLDGYEGLILAKFHAHKVYYAQLQLRELTRDKPMIEGLAINE